MLTLKAYCFALALVFATTGVITYAEPAYAKTKKSNKRPGSCGTYMYWKKGKCEDARNKTTTPAPAYVCRMYGGAACAK